MRIVVAGRTGQLARSLARTLPEAVCLDRDALDLNQPEQLADALRAQAPDMLINAAAYTAVDQAETELDEALRINGEAVAALARFAAEADIPFVHVSTDYVFSGNGTRPYIESDDTSPVNAYGKSKLAGEQAVLALNAPAAWVLRTSWVYSEFGNNFLKTMLRLARERDALRVVDDQRGRPTYAGDLAEAIGKLAERISAQSAPPGGIYHCTSKDEVSWCEFARRIFAQAQQAGLIDRQPAVEPVSTAEFPTPARRPGYSTLSTEKLERALDWDPPELAAGIARALAGL